MNPLAEILNTYPLVILDGALATELERRGCDLNDSLWSAKILLEAPELIKAVHADYFKAGADCATTATYQATFAGLARRGLDRTASAEIMRLAVQLAREARDEFWAEPAHQQGRPRPFVAASVGSYGAYLADGSEYRGDYGLSLPALMDFHRPRLAALAHSGADMLAAETIPCLTEALALATLLATEFPAVTAWISFSARDGAHVCHGEPLADCVAALEPFEQIAAVGINCTAPQYISALIAEARKTTTKPVLVYPNSGERFDPRQKTWLAAPAGTLSFSEQAQCWHTGGARIIGGCCRTTPADIAQIAAWARPDFAG